MTAPQIDKPQFVETATALLMEVMTMEELARGFGITPEQAAEHYVDWEPEILHACKVKELNGKAAEITATVATTIGTQRLTAILKDPESSDNAVLKATELAYRISGAEARRAAALKAADPEPVNDIAEPLWVINLDGHPPLRLFPVGSSKEAQARWIAKHEAEQRGGGE